MFTSIQRIILLGLTSAGLLYASAAPFRVFADEKDEASTAKTEAAKPSGANVNTPERALPDTGMTLLFSPCFPSHWKAARSGNLFAMRKSEASPSLHLLPCSWFLCFTRFSFWILNGWT